MCKYSKDRTPGDTLRLDNLEAHIFFKEHVDCPVHSNQPCWFPYFRATIIYQLVLLPAPGKGGGLGLYMPQIQAVYIPIYIWYTTNQRLNQPPPKEVIVALIQGLFFMTMTNLPPSSKPKLSVGFSPVLNSQ